MAARGCIVRPGWGDGRAGKMESLYNMRERDMYFSIYIGVQIYAYMYIHLHLYMYIYRHVYIYIYIHIFFMHACICMCVEYIPTYTYIYMYTFRIGAEVLLPGWMRCWTWPLGLFCWLCRLDRSMSASLAPFGGAPIFQLLLQMLICSGISSGVRLPCSHPWRP